MSCEYQRDIPYYYIHVFVCQKYVNSRIMNTGIKVARFCFRHVRTN